MAQVDHRPDGRLAVAVGITLAVTIVGPAVWAWSIADQLPSEVARHWGADGNVTGVWSLNVQLLVLGVMTLVVAGGLAAMAVLGRMPRAVRQMLAGCAVWLAVLLGSMQVAGLAGHLGIDDPFDARMPSAGIVLGIFGGVALAVIVARFATDIEGVARADGPPPPELSRLAPGVAPVTEVAAPSGKALTVVGVIVLLATATTSLFAVYWPVAIGFVVFAAIHLHTRFKVTIDRQQVRVGPKGWTMLAVPISDIAAADATEVDPFWEFGGWGLRVDVKGRTGIVIRQGAALRIVRGDGSEILVTIDDPQAAAATINTFADERFTTPTA